MKYIVQLHTEGIATDRDKVWLYENLENAIACFEKKAKEYEYLGVEENEERRVDPDKSEPTELFGRRVYVNSDETDTELTISDINLMDSDD